MIDIHCHILPNIDDGACNLDETFAMAKTAVKNGIHTVVATPHTLNGVYTNPAKEITRITSETQQSLNSAGITLKVLPGAEIHACPGLFDLIKNGDALTINNGGKYLMVELPSMAMPSEIKEEFFTLKLHGITPIIAHPERNLIFQNQTDLLEELVRMGVLCQVTAASITGSLGKTAQKCAAKLLEARLVHLIASDSHSAVNRPQDFYQALEIAADALKDESEAELMVTTTPEYILTGKPVDVPTPREIKKKKWFSFLRR
jgi:protein-tyrosine phosphatase